MNQLFPQNTLSDYIDDFRLSSVSNIRHIRYSIEGLVSEYKTGKINSLKEEEFKSRFLIEFFGNILGFNCGYSEMWLLREEKKTKVDGTKPDGALGYFFADKNLDDVRAIIEIKDSNTSLDEKQKRKNPKSAVEQAFEYPSKMGRSCKWVIISNIKEIRFYLACDRTKYQQFYLEELCNENKIRELLFLFHKDRFYTKYGNSKTDSFIEYIKNAPQNKEKEQNIIDDIYYSLKRFSGLEFVDPSYIASIPPFNLSGEYVLQYSNGCLTTSNNDILFLLRNITLEGGSITLSQELIDKLNHELVVDYQNKIEWSLKFLNQCLIRYINDVNINTHQDQVCDCIKCNYSNLEFRKLIEKLKKGISNPDKYTLDYAYGNYLLCADNYKITYLIYKSLTESLKTEENKHIDYFIVKLNLFLLRHYIEDTEEKKTAESIDLDDVIHNELEFYIDREVRDYLIRIKDNSLIHRYQDKIYDIVDKIVDLKELYNKGGQQFSESYLDIDLQYEFFKLYAHVNYNYIIYEGTYKYKLILKSVFKGLILHSQIPEKGISTYPFFILREAILNLPASYIKTILKDISKISISNEDKIKIRSLFSNLLNSSIDDSFGKSVYNKLFKQFILIYDFRERFWNLFSNLCQVCSKIEFDKSDLDDVITVLVKYLNIEDDLASFNIDELAKFVFEKGSCIKKEDLYNLLKIGLLRNQTANSKYNLLIKNVITILAREYPDFKITDRGIIIKSIANCYYSEGNSADFRSIIYLLKITDEDNIALLTNTIEEYLNNKFDSCLYDIMIRKRLYDYRKHDYFKKLIIDINKRGGKGYIGVENEIPRFTNFYMYNFSLLIYLLDIPFGYKDFEIFTNLGEFEKWMLNPSIYNSQNFDVNWLLAIGVERAFVFNRIKDIAYISGSLKESLKKDYNTQFAEIYFKYFQQ